MTKHADQNKGGHLLLVGHFGRGNAGDAAMLNGALTAFHKRGLRVVVGTESPGPFICTATGRARTCRLRSLSILREIKTSKGLIIGGGTLFVNPGLGWWRRILSYRYQSYWVGLAFIARLMGKPVFWIGLGVGPLNRRLSRFLLRLGIKLASDVVVRDPISLEEVRRTCQTKNVRQGFDLAPIGLQKPSISRNPHLIGISLTTIDGKDNACPPPGDPYWAKLSKHLEHILDENPSITLRFFVFSVGPREVDESLASEVIAHLPPVVKRRVALRYYDGDVSSFFEAVAECRAFLACRYHSLVLAAWAGCELGVLSYSRKVEDLANQLELPSSSMIRLDLNSFTGCQELVSSLVLGDCRPADIKVIQAREKESWLNFSLLTREE